MDELSAPRIEPSTQTTDLDKRAPQKGLPRKRQKPEKSLPSPSIEPDDPVEDIHQIDELA